MNLGKIVADGRVGRWTGGRVDIEGSTRGPRGPKKYNSELILIIQYE